MNAQKKNFEKILTYKYRYTRISKAQPRREIKRVHKRYASIAQALTTRKACAMLA